ncbi:hypothetical protein [Eilatimonas milleporae]|uniref:Uncharacterized protein n=1 Tax=Eilatimonas milleporae TaxID=911205 RepID=A0A3M0CDJ8_9PROT|nr:hypothetical protein [Eilatimonas milleporae]RMB07904.1 hypothetical protein BXY39_1998 [Eilatimonas milleporae]
MANHGFITNRRQLLIGLGTSTLTGSAMSLTASNAADDPAYAAFLNAQRAADRLNRYHGPEGTYLDTLYAAYITAERELVATPAISLPGLRGKLERLIAMTGWETEQDDIDAMMARSACADLNCIATHTSAKQDIL